MQIIRHPQHYDLTDCVATIGNFDGVHLGHQAIIEQVMTKANSLKIDSCLILFEPQPLEYFLQENAPARLSRLREKLMQLAKTSLDKVVILSFNQVLAAMSAENFITTILQKQLMVRHLIVGQDFRFGNDREGNVELLQQYLPIDISHTLEVQQQRISSTRIRVALAKAELSLAAELLGRPYTMVGRVAHGDKRGRDIGFPTANIHLHRQVIPLEGVFAVKLHGIGGQVLTGVANLGTRPTLDGMRTLLEVHIFDFADDIYGCLIEVEFCHKLRDEKRYPNLDELIAQISKDVEVAKAYFGH